ncbi:MAG: NADPH:quinone oxidoreductase family protein [Pseudomonadota bacterium]
MRALMCKEYGPPESLELVTLDDPEPGSGELLVDIQAAGLNFPDVLVIAGQYQVKTEPPFIPGNEAAGVVAAVGDGVTRFKPGDRVIAMPRGGTFADKCVVSESLAMPLLPGLDFAQGAGFAVTYGTSYHALRQSAALQAGERVLVLGAAGGVGITAVEIAKAMGAEVIAAASNDEKLEFAESAGADHLINYTKDSLREAVKTLTDGEGVNVVYDPVGGDLAQQALRSLAWHGRYLVIGFASGDIPALPANVALLKEASIVGVWWGTWVAKNPSGHIANVQALAALVADGKLTPRISERYPLENYADAFGAITERRALGKVVLTMGAS